MEAAEDERPTPGRGTSLTPSTRGEATPKAKRNYVKLPPGRKLELLKLLDAGVSKETLMKEFSVSRTTLYLYKMNIDKMKHQLMAKVGGGAGVGGPRRKRKRRTRLSWKRSLPQSDDEDLFVNPKVEQNEEETKEETPAAEEASPPPAPVEQSPPPIFSNPQAFQPFVPPPITPPIISNHSRRGKRKRRSINLPRKHSKARWMKLCQPSVGIQQLSTITATPKLSPTEPQYPTDQHASPREQVEGFMAEGRTRGGSSTAQDTTPVASATKPRPKPRPPGQPVHSELGALTGKGDQLHVQHNFHSQKILEVLTCDETFIDVTLTAEGRSVRAHKLILSAMSPYFQEVLQTNPCQHPVIIMPRTVRYSHLTQIIDFIYRGEITLPEEELRSLLNTAEHLQISGFSTPEIMKLLGENPPTLDTTTVSSTATTLPRQPPSDETGGGRQVKAEVRLEVETSRGGGRGRGGMRRGRGGRRTRGGRRGRGGRGGRPARVSEDIISSCGQRLVRAAHYTPPISTSLSPSPTPSPSLPPLPASPEPPSSPPSRAFQRVEGGQLRVDDPMTCSPGAVLGMDVDIDIVKEEVLSESEDNMSEGGGENVVFIVEGDSLQMCQEVPQQPQQTSLSLHTTTTATQPSLFTATTVHATPSQQSLHRPLFPSTQPQPLPLFTTTATKQAPLPSLLFTTPTTITTTQAKAPTVSTTTATPAQPQTLPLFNTSSAAATTTTLSLPRPLTLNGEPSGAGQSSLTTPKLSQNVTGLSGVRSPQNPTPEASSPTTHSEVSYEAVSPAPQSEGSFTMTSPAPPHCDDLSAVPSPAPQSESSYVVTSPTIQSEASYEVTSPASSSDEAASPLHMPGYEALSPTPGGGSEESHMSAPSPPPPSPTPQPHHDTLSPPHQDSDGVALPVCVSEAAPQSQPSPIATLHPPHSPMVTSHPPNSPMVISQSTHSPIVTSSPRRPLMVCSPQHSPMAPSPQHSPMAPSPQNSPMAPSQAPYNLTTHPSHSPKAALPPHSPKVSSPSYSPIMVTSPLIVSSPPHSPIVVGFPPHSLATVSLPPCTPATATSPQCCSSSSSSSKVAPSTAASVAQMDVLPFISPMMASSGLGSPTARLIVSCPQEASPSPHDDCSGVAPQPCKGGLAPAPSQRQASPPPPPPPQVSHSLSSLLAEEHVSEAVSPPIIGPVSAAASAPSPPLQCGAASPPALHQHSDASGEGASVHSVLITQPQQPSPQTVPPPQASPLLPASLCVAPSLPCMTLASSVSVSPPLNAATTTSTTTTALLPSLLRGRAACLVTAQQPASPMLPSVSTTTTATPSLSPLQPSQRCDPTPVPAGDLATSGLLGDLSGWGSNQPQYQPSCETIPLQFPEGSSLQFSSDLGSFQLSQPQYSGLGYHSTAPQYQPSCETIPSQYSESGYHPSPPHYTKLVYGANPPQYTTPACQTSPLQQYQPNYEASPMQYAEPHSLETFPPPPMYSCEPEERPPTVAAPTTSPPIYYDPNCPDSPHHLQYSQL